MAFTDKYYADYRDRLKVLNASKNPFAQGVAWVEGNIVPMAEARIPLADQGFLRSDLTYDVPSIWDGHFFRLDDHITRLEASCKKLRMKLPLSRDKIKQLLVKMAVKSGIRDAYVDLIVTRGLKGVRGSNPDELINCMYMFLVPYIWVMAAEQHHTGGSAIVPRSVRRIPPGSIDPTVKNLQWGDFTKGMLEAIDRGAVYPFLTDGDTNVTEGAGYNIVLIKNGVLYTPDRGVLEGVTRRTVLDVAKAKGIEVRVQIVPVEMLYSADEIFMCTTAGGIMPITNLDGQPVNGGKVGQVTKSIWDGYWAMHYDPKYTIAINYDAQQPSRSSKL